MPTRKHFIAAAASVPLLAAAPPSPAPASATPSPPMASPAPSATKKKISPLAREFAARMRDFDADLSDRQIEKIAASIDDNLKIGKNLNPKGRAIKNSDEPATTFEVPS